MGSQRRQTVVWQREMLVLKGLGFRLACYPKNSILASESEAGTRKEGTLHLGRRASPSNPQKSPESELRTPVLLSESQVRMINSNYQTRHPESNQQSGQQRKLIRSLQWEVQTRNTFSPRLWPLSNHFASQSQRDVFHNNLDHVTRSSTLPLFNALQFLGVLGVKIKPRCGQNCAFPAGPLLVAHLLPQNCPILGCLQIPKTFSLEAWCCQPPNPTGQERKDFRTRHISV